MPRTLHNTGEHVYGNAHQDHRGWPYASGHRPCRLSGRVKEAEWLTPIVQHPNWKAILEAVPKATHLAGRVPLTWDEALVAQAALNEAREEYETSPTGIAERLRRSINVVTSIRD